MQVWVYPEKSYEELGAERWEVEWQTVRPSALKRIEAAEARGEEDEVDPDRDIIFHYKHYPTEAKALRAARAIVNLGHSAYGCATVVKQVVDWYVEEDRVAEWSDVGEAIYVP
jgi:hypothetical protein